MTILVFCAVVYGLRDLSSCPATNPARASAWIATPGRTGGDRRQCPSFTSVPGLSPAGGAETVPRLAAGADLEQLDLRRLVNDSDQSGAAVCAELADPRSSDILPTRSKSSPRATSTGASRARTRTTPTISAVLEDDNFLLPAFFAENIALCRKQGVNLVLRNQFIELGFGTPEARLSEAGVLDELFTEGIFEPAAFRLSLLMGIGVSNGEHSGRVRPGAPSRSATAVPRRPRNTCARSRSQSRSMWR